MNILDIFTNISLILQDQNLLVKIALSLILIMFLLFTIILARQTSSLTTLINQTTFSPAFKMTAYLLAVTTLLLLIAVIFV